MKMWRRSLGWKVSNKAGVCKGGGGGGVGPGREGGGGGGGGG